MACGDSIPDEILHSRPEIVQLYLAVSMCHTEMTSVCGVMTVIKDCVAQLGRYD